MGTKVMIACLKQRLPYANPNPSNLSFDCGCKLLEIEGQEFKMEPKCMKHLIKYYNWKITNKALPMNGLKLTYKWNEYSDGSMGIIK